MNHKIKVVIDNIKAAFGGAALSLATKEAAEKGGSVTIIKVNKWAKTLNRIAGFFIFTYVLSIFMIGVGANYAPLSGNIESVKCGQEAQSKAE